MREVGLYVNTGDEINNDIIHVTFVLDGVTYDYDVPKIDIESGKNKYQLITDLGILNIFYSDISFTWALRLDNEGTVIFNYNKLSDADYPIFSDWIWNGGEIELESITTTAFYQSNYQRLDLFGDETIEITSSIQNVQDISKVFSDFSQGFTIPATTRNNAILNHFYESSVNQLYDYQISFNAYIEIDSIPFKRGKLSVDKAQIKYGDAYCYNVQFFGHLASLKDTFGELKLSDLDFNQYSHDYNGTEVTNRITDGTTSYDVRYPLISSERTWEYGTGTPNDISTLVGEIGIGELLPAIRVASIFDLIGSKFEINFQSVFFQSKVFRNLFLYLKNAPDDAIKFMFQDLQFSTFTDDIFRVIDLANNSLNYTFGTAFVDGAYTNNFAFVTRLTDIVTSVTGAEWRIQVYKNGLLVNTVNGYGTQTDVVVYTEQNALG